MKFTYTKLIVILILLAVMAACLRDETLPDPSHPVFSTIPAYFPPPQYGVHHPTRSREAFELGRQLFYDPALSLDSTISCASCHRQSLAFSDETAFSLGVHGRLGSRNSPPLFNLIWNTSFMWDGGINHIEIMPIAPITDSSEMAIPMRTLNERLNASQKYRKMFSRVYRSDSITDKQTLLALTQFMSALVSSESKYDAYMKGQMEALNAIELEGMALVQEHCGNCHDAPLFTNFTFRNNGTFMEGKDPGRFLITQKIEDKGKFKVPSLRNVAITAPYMHDGRFHTLEEVMHHYIHGIQSENSVDPLLTSGLSLNDHETNAIIAFLHTLTDESFIHQPYFANPGNL